MDTFITLDKKLGVNPRMIKIHCFACNQVKSDSILLLGHKNYKIKCPQCGTWNIGGMSRVPAGYYQCNNPTCKQDFASIRNLERVELTEWEDFEQLGICSDCQELMEQGIILISVRDSDTDTRDPYRTGGWVVIKEEALNRIVDDKDLFEQIKSKRLCFIPDSTWNKIGLPKQKETTDNRAKLGVS